MNFSILATLIAQKLRAAHCGIAIDTGKGNGQCWLCRKEVLCWLAGVQQGCTAESLLLKSASKLAENLAFCALEVRQPRSLSSTAARISSTAQEVAILFLKKPRAATVDRQCVVYTKR